MRYLTFLMISIVLSGCIPRSAFQRARHDAEYWHKKGERYNFNIVLADMKKCGWLPPKESLDENGKVKMELYQQVRQCMVSNGYVHRTP